MAKVKKSSRPKAIGSGKPSSDTQRIIFAILLAGLIAAGAILIYQYWLDNRGNIGDSAPSITSTKKGDR